MGATALVSLSTIRPPDALSKASDLFRLLSVFSDSVAAAQNHERSSAQGPLRTATVRVQISNERV